MLVTSIFSFSHNVSILSKTNFDFRITFILSSASASDLDKSEILLFGKELSPNLNVRVLVPVQPDDDMPICK